MFADAIEACVEYYPTERFCSSSSEPMIVPIGAIPAGDSDVAFYFTDGVGESPRYNYLFELGT